MILFEVDPARVVAVELECDAPRPVDMHREARWLKPPECMKIEPRDVHVLRCGRCVEAVESKQQPSVKPRVYLCTSAVRPKVGERFAPERADHSPNVSGSLTCVNESLTYMRGDGGAVYPS